MSTKTLPLINQLGLHARAAMKLIDTASRYGANIKLTKGDNTVDAKDIMGVMALGAVCGDEVTLSAEGDDAEQAVAALVALINDRFGEEQ